VIAHRERIRGWEIEPCRDLKGRKDRPRVTGVWKDPVPEAGLGKRAIVGISRQVRPTRMPEMSSDTFEPRDLAVAGGDLGAPRR
jgi:hypothetical protein